MKGTASTVNRRALLLCFHNHQPVGNFESVLEEATRDSYLPFLKVLAEFPSIRVTIHYSGWLLQWIEEHSTETFSLLKRLVFRGQVEVLGGGMYEPVLALLSERDRLGQIDALSTYLERRFGKTPEGIWLAERVWEPELPATLYAAGVKYLPLDDYHFVRAGLETEKLDGLYLTEHNGATVGVFPGSERLRYLIPFGGVDETLREIEQMTSRDVPFPAAIFADDGEKFGVWPKTYEHVYEGGWLRSFFEGIVSRADRFTTMTLGEYAAAAPLRGRVYLPACSYIEMGEWTLPADRAARFGELLGDFRSGKNLESKPFVQGGFFRNFLRKYEEANQLHKRMLSVSGLVEAAEASNFAKAKIARDFLYRSQANDVYWHGVFGGLYLNHLREAAWSNLLRAEADADAALRGSVAGWTDVTESDLDCDGGTELLMKTGGLTLFSHAHDGGAITEISLPTRGITLGHLLTRRAEGYHEKCRKAAGVFDGSTSIHDALVLKDPSVLDALGVDSWQRASFREEFYGKGDSPEAIFEDALPLAVSAGKEALVDCVQHGARIVAWFKIPLVVDGVDLLLEKALVLRGGEERFIAVLKLRNLGQKPVSGTLCSEWNLNMLSGEGVERYYDGLDGPKGLSSSGVSRGVREFKVVDGWRNVAAQAVFNRNCDVLRRPVETVSLSEKGVEKIHQGICLKVLFPVSIEPGRSDSYLIRWVFDSVS